MDGLLVVDKPPGPTSHDVVARVRRVLGERRIGHTGTLDPQASGVLPLVVGRATRLARFLTDAEKGYEAIIRLGVRTETYDRGGNVVATFEGALPSAAAIDRALGRFRGTFLQQPPAFSAKKIAGRRSYAIARAASRTGGGVTVDSRPVSLPAPVTVTANEIELVRVDHDLVTVRVECSAGFYVRSLAEDLGNDLGVGAHLAELRRVRAGDYTVADTVNLSTIEQSPDEAIRHLIPPARMLRGLQAAVLTAEGVLRTRRGISIGPPEFVAAGSSITVGPLDPVVRLLDEAGQLVAVARRIDASGLLHPFVVLM